MCYVDKQSRAGKYKNLRGRTKTAWSLLLPAVREIKAPVARSNVCKSSVNRRGKSRSGICVISSASCAIFHSSIWGYWRWTDPPSWCQNKMTHKNWIFSAKNLMYLKIYVFYPQILFSWMRVSPLIACFCKSSPLPRCPDSCSKQVWPVWKCSTRNLLCQAVMLDFIDGLSFTIDVANVATGHWRKQDLQINYAIASKCLGFLKHQSSS